MSADAQSPAARDVDSVPYPRPAVRKLRAYAFDPQTSTDLATATINDSLIALPWEQPWERPLAPGPYGEYIEVIDHDPASGLFYHPVDLDDPLLLAQNGLPPSEGRPQFHQQMVYAVAMKTVRAFERALGRTIYWAREYAVPPPALEAQGLESANAPPPTTEDDILLRPWDLVARLRIYPHAIREKNAYYSPQKTAILFGYFQPSDPMLGDRWVFTCLSQDIVAHETTHALLHGVHRRSIQPSNPDTLAFHEGFADIVALLQHFTMVDVLRQQIARSRGSLRANSLLNSLAGQFGRALGRESGALRVALDMVERERQANLTEDRDARAKLLAGTRLSDDVREAHDRGGFLVAAVFDAFATIYERRTADLMRIALGTTQASGAELPPDLVARLANEAGKAADHVLRMCVRALDYVPPVDMTFGEYLRAVVTADADLVPDDPMGYRVAFAQAFRRRGIVPADSLSMSPDSLVWDRPDPSDLPQSEARTRGLFATLLPTLTFGNSFGQMADVNGDPIDFFKSKLSFREMNAYVIKANQERVHAWFNEPTAQDDVWERLVGVKLLDSNQLGATPALHTLRWLPTKDRTADAPVIQVYTARVARRTGPDGQELNQLVIQIVQKRRAFLDPARQQRADAGELPDAPPDFWFRGGATLLVDLRDGGLRYTVRKSIVSDGRLARQRDYERDRLGLVRADRYVEPGIAAAAEPFAMIHRS